MPRDDAPTEAVTAARRKLERAENKRFSGGTGRVLTRPDGQIVADLSVPVRDLDAHGLRVVETLPPAFLTPLLRGDFAPRHDVTGTVALAWEASEEAAIDLWLGAHADAYRLRGTIQATLRHPCVRCLQPVDVDLSFELDLHVVEGSSTLFPGQSAEVDPQGLAALIDASPATGLHDDEDFVTFSGDAIDVAAILREQLLLEVPMHPRCDVDGRAPGVCPFDARSDEVPVTGDPRWAQLKHLYDKLPRGDA